MTTAPYASVDTSRLRALILTAVAATLPELGCETPSECHTLQSMGGGLPTQVPYEGPGMTAGAGGGAGGGIDEPSCSTIDSEDPRYMCTTAFGSTCPAKDDSALLTDLGRAIPADSCGCGEFVNTVLCGPELTAGGCCYVVDVAYSICEGRPMLASSGAILAAVRPGMGWCTPLGVDTRVDATTPHHRAALAVAWTDAALAEHGSIASFARASLELLALGAPAALLREIHDAMGDEIAHAELCFSLASELGGAPVGPGTLPLPGTLALRTTPIECAVATVVEGCINETLCALVAQAQHDAATVPGVRAALLRIAEDEARHAALAWKTVAWLIREHGAPVREAVREAFAQAPALDLAGPSISEVPTDVARAWGRLPSSELRDVLARGMADVVAPSARVLLSTDPTARRDGETTATA